MENKNIVGIVVILVIAVISFMLFSGYNISKTETPSGGAVAVKDVKEYTFTDDCDAIQSLAIKSLDTDMLYIDRMVPNTLLNTCDMHLKTTAEYQDLCKEFILRTNEDFEIECVPVKGAFCNMLCNNVND